MTSRERQLATIRHQIPDRIPVDSICIENIQTVADHFAMSVPDAYDRLGIDGRIVGPGYTGECGTAPDGTPLSDFGTISTGDYRTDKWYPFSIDTTVAEVERFRWPDPKHYDTKGMAGYTAEVAKKYATRGPYWMPVFCQVCDLFGMEIAMEQMLAEPAVFDAAVERVADVVCQVCINMMEDCGDDLDILCLGDDFATQRGMMISPDSWRKHLKPHYARIFAEAKKRGKLVWFHSCGDVSAVLPDFIEIGIDLWETVQLHTLPFSAEHLKKEYGKDLAFFGAVNTQRLPFVSPEEVKEETLRCIELLGKDGGYICGPDHHVKPQVTVSNTLALFDTATSFQRSGYTLVS